MREAPQMNFLTLWELVGAESGTMPANTKNSTGTTLETAMTRAVRSATAALAILLVVQGVAAAQSVAEFYRGKSIKMVIATAAGGEYDVWARLVIRHMGKHWPGKPN